MVDDDHVTVPLMLTEVVDVIQPTVMNMTVALDGAEVSLSPEEVRMILVHRKLKGARLVQQAAAAADPKRVNNSRVLATMHSYQELVEIDVADRLVC
jgi:hypothetical protein